MAAGSSDSCEGFGSLKKHLKKLRTSKKFGVHFIYKLFIIFFEKPIDESKNLEYNALVKIQYKSTKRCAFLRVKGATIKKILCGAKEPRTMAELVFLRGEIMELVEKSQDRDLLDLVYKILVSSQVNYEEDTGKFNRAVI